VGCGSRVRQAWQRKGRKVVTSDVQARDLATDRPAGWTATGKDNCRRCLMNRGVDACRAGPPAATMADAYGDNNFRPHDYLFKGTRSG